MAEKKFIRDSSMMKGINVKNGEDDTWIIVMLLVGLIFYWFFIKKKKLKI
jgi:hypothetical protein